MHAATSTLVLAGFVLVMGTAVTSEMAPDTTAPSGSIMNEVGHSVAPEIAVARDASGGATAPQAPAYTWGDAVRDVVVSEAVTLASDHAAQQLSPVLGQVFGAQTGRYLTSSIVGVVSSLAYGEGFGSALGNVALSTIKQIGLDELRETSTGAVIATAIETAEVVHSTIGFVQACTQSGPQCLAGAPTQVRSLVALGQSWKDTAAVLEAEAAAASCNGLPCEAGFIELPDCYAGAECPTTDEDLAALYGLLAGPMGVTRGQVAWGYFVEYLPGRYKCSAEQSGCVVLNFRDGYAMRVTQSSAAEVARLINSKGLGDAVSITTDSATAEFLSTFTQTIHPLHHTTCTESRCTLLATGVTYLDPVGNTVIEFVGTAGVGAAGGLVVKVVKRASGWAVRVGDDVVVQVASKSEAIAQGRQLAQIGLGLGYRNTAKVLRTASEPYKGTTRLGYALSKHAGRHPEIWGKVTGASSTWHAQAMRHFRDVLRGPGQFQRVTNDKGITFLEKRLADGRGVRLQLDYTFKGFLD